jgi:hypothetical protein
MMSKIAYKKNAGETTEQKEGKRKKPKPEEQEGMPQRQSIFNRRGLSDLLL